jgi:hypothetical protein
MSELENVMKSWDEDSIINPTEPGKELLKIPVLHNKYVKLLIKNKLSVKNINFEYSKLRRIKEEYYNGSISQEELNQYGWEPFLLSLRTKNGVDKYIDSDEELIKLLKRKMMVEETVFLCESIIKELNSRTFQLRDYISWEKFIGGN